MSLNLYIEYVDGIHSLGLVTRQNMATRFAYTVNRLVDRLSSFINLHWFWLTRYIRGHSIWLAEYVHNFTRLD